MKVCVVGGAGFLGTNLVRRLDSLGIETVVLDDMSTGSMVGLPVHVPVVEEEITQMRESRWAFGDSDVFVNCACVHLPASVEDPETDETVHVLGTLRLLEEARRIDAKVVHISSCSVYGNQSCIPIDECAPLHPFTPYAAGKLGGESYALAYHAHNFVNATVLRPSNIYGPWQDTRVHKGVVGKFLQAKIDGETAEVYGDFTRDFTYVEDIVDAILLAMETDESGPFNVATGVETSISDLADAIGVKRKPGTPRSVDTVNRRCLSRKKIQEVLGWTPKTSLTDGLARTEEWMRGALCR